MNSNHGAPLRATSSDWHRLSASFSVRFSITDEGFGAQWSPKVPTPREMKRLLTPYRLARDAFVRAFAAQRGVRIAVLEAPL